MHDRSKTIFKYLKAVFWPFELVEIYNHSYYNYHTQPLYIAGASVLTDNPTLWTVNYKIMGEKKSRSTPLNMQTCRIFYRKSSPTKKKEFLDITPHVHGDQSFEK
jgi:hypothetical protein